MRTSIDKIQRTKKIIELYFPFIIKKYIGSRIDLKLIESMEKELNHFYNSMHYKEELLDLGSIKLKSDGDSIRLSLSEEQKEMLGEYYVL